MYIVLTGVSLSTFESFVSQEVKEGPFAALNIDTFVSLSTFESFVSQEVKEGPFAALNIDTFENFIFKYFQKTV